MGTRSLTIVRNYDNTKDLVTIYRQFDGYPAGHGHQLKTWAHGKQLINGIRSRDSHENAWNGMGCLAADLVATLKVDAGLGGIYLYPNGTEGVGEEWVYTLYDAQGALHLRVASVYGNQTLFDGPMTMFEPADVEAAREATR